MMQHDWNQHKSKLYPFIVYYLVYTYNIYAHILFILYLNNIFYFITFIYITFYIFVKKNNKTPMIAIIK